MASALSLFFLSPVWAACFLLPRVLATAADAQGGGSCPPATCGNLNIKLPFGIVPDEATLTNCGEMGFQVRCSDDIPYLGYNQRQHRFRILDIFYHNASLIVEDVHKLDVLNSSAANASCRVPANNSSTTVASPFSISPLNQELILYDCIVVPPGNLTKQGLMQTNCHNTSFIRGGGRYDEESGKDSSYFLEGCNATLVPVRGGLGKVNASNYLQLVSDGFILTWLPPTLPTPKSGKNGYNRRTIRIVLVVAAGSLLLPCIYVLIWLCKRTRSSNQMNIEALISSHGSLAPKRYKYAETTKITSHFNNKLGEGGYGVVFRGILQDGRQVAVKLLHGSKANGEEFVNEVMSIGRTSHVNIVSLFGFCLEGSKRALKYEYMPNGSLDRYIYSENPKSILGWEKLYIIAVGIARGLEYLHHSCNTRIVHFDIKPQNILLDHNFCPKIADFGLAKLCYTKESKLSMTGARGTIGFIAPEVHSRTFGVVSTKSDVYSYGMLLLEMVGGRKNVKSVVEKSSQKYFPEWIYDHFAQDDGLQACQVTQEVEEIAKKMSLIGLWCVQVLPMHRPTITQVLEMFERGSHELDMPPKQNFDQIIEDSPYEFSAEGTSSNPSTTQAYSAEESLMNSEILQCLPTL